MRGNQKGSYKLAFCSLMAALGVVIMLSSGLIPVLTYCAPLTAALLLIPARRECGGKWAALTWLVTALLSMLLCTDREAAFFYLFLGSYPLLKPVLDALPGAWSWIAKLLYFLLVLALLYALLLFILGLELGQEEGWISMLIFYLVLTATMLVYDRAVGSIALLYEKRLRPKLMRGRET